MMIKYTISSKILSMQCINQKDGGLICLTLLKKSATQFFFSFKKMICHQFEQFDNSVLHSNTIKFSLWTIRDHLPKM